MSSKGSWVGRLPDDPQPIVYHGAHAGDSKALIDAGCPNFCISYYEYYRYFQTHPQGNPHYDPWTLRFEMYNECGARVMIDSGAFTFHSLLKQSQGKWEDEKIRSYLQGPQVDRQKKGDGTDPLGYVPWVKARRYPFDFCVTFDYRIDCDLIYKMTTRLWKMGVDVVPVYHGDKTIDWLRRYIDHGCKLVCIARGHAAGRRSGLRRYYDQVFTVTEAAGIACHGLACTGSEMWEYPWYSVDSATLVKAAGNGVVWFLSSRNRIEQVALSNNFRGRVPDELLAQAEARGVSIDTLRAERTPRVLFNGQTIYEFTKNRKGVCRVKKTLF